MYHSGLGIASVKGLCLCIYMPTKHLKKATILDRSFDVREVALATKSSFITPGYAFLCSTILFYLLFYSILFAILSNLLHPGFSTSNGSPSFCPLPPLL